MRVATFNVNGIRAALRRGFAEWLAGCRADVVALQEVRCRPADLPAGAFGDYRVAYHPGGLAGRNGVALLTRGLVTGVDTGGGDLAPWADEGRWISADLADEPVTVASLYVPRGGLPAGLGRGTSREGRTPEQEQARYDGKLAFLAALARKFDALRADAARAGREVLVLGDCNIAHEELDVRNWKANLDGVGFLPAERAWFGRLLGGGDVVDVVRRLFPGQDGPYSWWSWRGRAYDTDAGWRIDYHLATTGLAARATAARVDRAPDYGHRVSDHAPVVVDYALR